MAYIANKPVRFDRDYKVGEIIPDAVIAPSMTRKLVEMGRILRVDLPQNGGTEETNGQPQSDPQDGAESAPGGDSGEGDINTQPDSKSPQDGTESGAEGGLSVGDLIAGTAGEFVCDNCGRTFQTQQGLAAHTRSHKE